MLAALSYIVSVLLVSIWKEYLCFPMFLVTAYGKNVPAVVEQPLEEEKCIQEKTLLHLRPEN